MMAIDLAARSVHAPAFAAEVLPRQTFRVRRRSGAEFALPPPLA
jgi:hypothetical protein